jgi:hypothetical protein
VGDDAGKIKDLYAERFVERFGATGVFEFGLGIVAKPVWFWAGAGAAGFYFLPGGRASF